MLNQSLLHDISNSLTALRLRMRVQEAIGRAFREHLIDDDEFDAMSAALIATI